VPAGFERSRGTEPIVGVFYEGIHGRALLNTGCIYSNRGDANGRG
jgi:hypothetical protein